MAETKSVTEPTANEIVVVILEMYGALLLNDGFPETPFPENVREAIAKFNKPGLRTSLARRLFHPETYVSAKSSTDQSASKDHPHHCPHACCNGGGF